MVPLVALEQNLMQLMAQEVAEEVVVPLQVLLEQEQMERFMVPEAAPAVEVVLH